MAGSSADRLGALQRSGSKPARKSGGGFFTRIVTFYNGVMTEMRKVTWPTKENLKTYTIVVLVSAIIFSIVMGLWDVLLGFLLQQFLNLGA